MYLRKAEPDQLRSLRLIITGAEKLPLDLASHFEERFHKKVFEGYGLTETAPVVSTNLPIQNRKSWRTCATIQPARVCRQNGARNRRGNSQSGNEPKTFAASHRHALAARAKHFEGYLTIQPDRRGVATLVKDRRYWPLR